MFVRVEIEKGKKKRIIIIVIIRTCGSFFFPRDVGLFPFFFFFSKL